MVHKYILHKKIYRLNIENLPSPDEPYIMVANHQNGIFDALALSFLSNQKRYPVFIARADVFKNSIAKKVLTFFKLLPAFRIQDVGVNNVGNNEQVFSLASNLLHNYKGVLVIFPEGGHQEKQRLGTLKKGFTRIAFQAVEQSSFTKPIKIVPIGLHYSHVGLQSTLTINVGKSVSTEPYHNLYQTSPEKAQNELKNDVQNALKNVMLHIEEDTYYAELKGVCDITAYHAKRNKSIRKLFDNPLLLQKATIDKLMQLKEKNNDAYIDLMQQTRRFFTIMTSVGLQLRSIVPHQRTDIQKIKTFFYYILTFPLRIMVSVVHIVPYLITRFITRKIEDELLRTSLDLAIGGMFIFPMWYLFIIFLVSILGVNSLIIFTIALLLPLSSWLFFRSFSFWKKLQAIYRKRTLVTQKCPAIKIIEAFYKDIISRLPYSSI